MMDKTGLLSMFNTWEAIDASRRKELTGLGGRGQLSSSVENRKETSPTWWGLILFFLRLFSISDF